MVATATVGVSPKRANRLSLADGVIVELQRPLSRGSRCGDDVHTQTHGTKSPGSPGRPGWGRGGSGGTCCDFSFSLFKIKHLCVKPPSPK